MWLEDKLQNIINDRKNSPNVSISLLLLLLNQPFNVTRPRFNKNVGGNSRTNTVCNSMILYIINNKSSRATGLKIGYVWSQLCKNSIFF